MAQHNLIANKALLREVKRTLIELTPNNDGSFQIVKKQKKKGAGSVKATETITEVLCTIAFSDPTGAAKLEQYLQGAARSKLRVTYEPAAEQEELPGTKVDQGEAVEAIEAGEAEAAEAPRAAEGREHQLNRAGAPLATEAQIQEAIGDLLQLDGWRIVRTDPVSDRQRGKGFGEPGMADCLYIRYGKTAFKESAEVMWIEHKKTLRNGQPTKPKQHQLDWHRAERARGALTLIAGEDFPASVDGFLAWYRASGLMNRRI